ncbi:MAG: hypothetical protein KIT79_09800 [Deltaproteobacteria bacterium]|nr:hypothetical protein [Deltaproteobacteria bacterium]
MLQAIRSWHDRQIGEIEGDRVLRYYGAALASANTITWFHWAFVRRGLEDTLGPKAMALCWPFWENCHEFRPFQLDTLHLLLWGYAALTVAVGAFFVTGKVRWGYWGLVLVTALRLFILFQDFRLRANQHYMANWVTLAYLAFPARRVLIPHLLVWIYFWAGALKLDREWFTGAALYKKDKLWVPDALIPASCVYVVVMEMVLVFGIYARRAWLFWVTFAQLVVFHIFSWPIVGLFYPMLMFCLISIFPLGRLMSPAGQWPTLKPLVPKEYRLAAVMLLGGFGFFQAIPYAFPGDSAVTGEGRLFALHMFDALVECDATAVIRFENGETKPVPVNQYGRRLARRIRCDPVVHFSIARHLCRQIRERPGAIDLDYTLRSKRTSDPDLSEVMAIENFCAADLTYDLWRPNSWIQK